MTIETVTRPPFDGGGDALCKDRVGPIADQISLDFALEAKCYAWATESDVKELSRLISRHGVLESWASSSVRIVGHTSINPAGAMTESVMEV